MSTEPTGPEVPTTERTEPGVTTTEQSPRVIPELWTAMCALNDAAVHTNDARLVLALKRVQIVLSRSGVWVCHVIDSDFRER